MKLDKLHQHLKAYGLSLLDVATLEKIIYKKIEDIEQNDYQRIYKLRRLGFVDGKKKLAGVEPTDRGRDLIQLLYSL